MVDHGEVIVAATDMIAVGGGAFVASPANGPNWALESNSRETA